MCTVDFAYYRTASSWVYKKDLFFSIFLTWPAFLNKLYIYSSNADGSCVALHFEKNTHFEKKFKYR